MVRKTLVIFMNIILFNEGQDLQFIGLSWKASLVFLFLSTLDSARKRKSSLLPVLNEIYKTGTYIPSFW